MLWYASYGSNQSAARFLTYLRGGVAPGSLRHTPGARDRSDPIAVAACWLPHRLFFAGSSRTWGGGGVAFIDPAAGSGRTPGRRYLVTTAQFQDVLAQESGRPVGSSFDLGALTHPGSVVVGDGGYDRVVALEPVDGLAVVTFTTPAEPATLVPADPAPAYLTTIVGGIVEGHGVTEAEARAMVVAAQSPAPHSVT